MYKIYLKKNEERRIVAGHPWVFANEVARIEGKGKNGDEASVHSFDGRYIGKGFINHLSKILVRIMTTKDCELDLDFFVQKFERCKALRQTLGYENNCRLVFGEADGVAALIVDKYSDILSVQFLSLGLDLRKKTIVEALVKVFSPRGIFERSDVAVREKEGLPLVKDKLWGDFETKIEICEYDIKMLVDVENGQKTGYFLDQKENRKLIRKYCKNKKVLDCFSNVGGFALSAAFAGAEEVTAVDISELAVQNIEDNAKRNGLKIATICGDVFEVLRTFQKEGKKFDVIVLDPPAFCKTADQANDALRGYRDINILAMKLLCDGGILASCSCSHHISMQSFEKMLQSAAENSKKTVRILERGTQSPDHPALIAADETLYLKFYIMQVCND